MNDNQENLLDHYVNPRNYNKPNFNSDTSAKLLNASCGDELSVQLSIQNNILKDISFGGEGCSIAIGTASQLFEKLIGMDIDKILTLEDTYPEELIGIPLTISRKKCATLPLETIKEAIRHYNKDNR